MLGSVTIEIAIGLVFVYVLVSILCTAVREGLESLLKTRAAYLNRGIREILQDRNGDKLAKAMFAHPMMASLFGGDPPSNAKGQPKDMRGFGWLLARGHNLPSYVPSKNFAIALMDLAARGLDTDVVTSDPTSPVLSLENVRAGLLNLQNKEVQRALLVAIDTAQGDLNQAQKNIEEWFDSSMDRVSGWYKRSTGKIIFTIALLVTVSLNVDSIRIMRHLQVSKTARDMVVAQAEKFSKTQDSAAKADVSATVQELERLNLPIGWDAMGSEFGKAKDEGQRIAMGLTVLAGWLMTAFAATLGAPFWFDVLNRLMVIRATVKPTEKSPPEGSEDRPNKDVTGGPTPPAMAPAPVGSPAPTAAAPPVPVQQPRDEESGTDACGIDRSDPAFLTSDEDLPPAKGGVQQEEMP